MLEGGQEKSAIYVYSESVWNVCIFFVRGRSDMLCSSCKEVEV